MRRGEAAVVAKKGRASAQYAGGVLPAGAFVRACLL